MEAELGIYLNDILAGVLRAGPGEQRIEFRLDTTYKRMYPRPILGQAFEDNLDRPQTGSVRLPPFFSNLLPEGVLRFLVARKVGVKEVRELFLLAHLGEDLPGAVRAIPLTDLDRQWAALPPAAEATQEPGLRFSLAGVQLKFSMLRQDRGLTLPARGQDGDWIVKLPDNRFARVPENEYSMLAWARAAGIEVPDHDLVPVSALQGLPRGVTPLRGQALAVRRFDRPEGSPRVHQEDFAQILGLYPKQKYDAYNYETIGSIILRTAGTEDFLAFVQRLTFMALSGNSDAHHKNWSLRYPDGVTARLSPAYDQVATIVYVPEVEDPRPLDTLALNFAKSKLFADVSLKSFARMGDKLGVSPDLVSTTAVEAAQRIQDAWRTVHQDLPLDAATKAIIERHWHRVPLAQGA